MAEKNMELEFIKDYLNFLLEINSEKKNNVDKDIEGLTNSLNQEDIEFIQSLFEKLYNSDNNLDLSEHILNQIKNVRS